MKTLTFYKLLCGILLLINIAFMVFIAFKPPHPDRPPHPRDMLTPKELNLDNNQMEQFIKLVEKHKKQLKKVENQEKKWIDRCFLTKIEIDSNNTSPDFLQQKMILTQTHFNEVRAILNEKQIEHFEEFKKNIVQRIIKKERK